MLSMTDILAVAAGGATGAVARYLCQSAVPLLGSEGVATMTVNVSGSFIIGVVWVLLRHYSASSVLPLIIITGFLGGFTTFSTFSLDTVKFVEQGNMLRAFTYAGGTVLLSLLACGSAVYLTSRILR